MNIHPQRIVRLFRRISIIGMRRFLPIVRQRLKRRWFVFHYKRAHNFYTAIPIQIGQTSELIPDIKKTWDVARGQHLTYASKQEFINFITKWHAENPYLYGSNWVCPMEVAIRAINWIYAYEQFSFQETEHEFIVLFSQLLGNHMQYLEYNWELYDGKTSNHYIANLVGYLYLCWFFRDQKKSARKIRWCLKQLWKELRWQVFEEGTLYEGSTAYHQLVTELFCHVIIICQKVSYKIPVHILDTIGKMFTFIEWCKPNADYMVKIGDDDSATTLAPQHSQLIIKQVREKLDHPMDSGREIIHYEQFGLSILKTKGWHVTFRHHVYANKQPTGHHHSDAHSITVAIDGIPIFIDPGSYVYTPSHIWRNRFRSAAMHSTFYYTDYEPLLFDERLFAVEIPEAIMPRQPDGLHMHAHHQLYKQFNLVAHREVIIDKRYQFISINDWWEGLKPSIPTSWQFICAPEIQLHKKQGDWLMLYQEKAIARITSDLPLEKQRTWVSLSYGKKQRAWCLRAQQRMNPYVQMWTHIIKC